MRVAVGLWWEAGSSKTEVSPPWALMMFSHAL